MTEIESKSSSVMIPKDLAKGHSSRERKTKAWYIAYSLWSLCFLASSLYAGMANLA